MKFATNCKLSNNCASFYRLRGGNVQTPALMRFESV